MPSFETGEAHRYLNNWLGIFRARGGDLLDHPYRWRLIAYVWLNWGKHPVQQEKDAWLFHHHLDVDDGIYYRLGAKNGISEHTPGVCICTWYVGICLFLWLSDTHICECWPSMINVILGAQWNLSYYYVEIKNLFSTHWILFALISKTDKNKSQEIQLRP